jgi:hypothetical protein
MKMKTQLFLLALACLASVTTGRAQSTAFSYQGRLTDNGAPANGRYDLRAALFDSASGAILVGATNTLPNVAVSNGLFTVHFDFGDAWTVGGVVRWLELSVRTNGGWVFTTPPPRQAILPVPSACWAANASQAVTISGTVPASGLNGLYSNPVSFNNPANSFSGNGAGLTSVNAAQRGDRTAAQFWQTGGNAGRSLSTDFIGPTDNQPVMFQANNQRALRLEPTTDDPNLISGHPDNVMFNGVVGSVIAGDGASNLAQANHTGAFVWADSLDADFVSTAANQFSVRTTGGLRVETGSGPGICLNAADTPLLTRRWDAFGPTAPGTKQGQGRWNLFMEPFRPDIGIPNTPGGRYVEVAK